MQAMPERLQTYPTSCGNTGGGTLNGYNLDPAGFSNNITSNSQYTYQTANKNKRKTQIE